MLCWNVRCVKFPPGIRCPLGSMPADAIPMSNGGWRAMLTNPDGTTMWVAYRPAGSASDKTLGTIATLEINDPLINGFNGGAKNILKLKFPQTGALGPGGVK